MLEENRVAAPRGVEEARPEIAVREQHRDRAREHRQREKHQKGRHENRPDEQRHAMQRHSRRAHVEDRRDQVHGPDDGRRARQVNREYGEVNRGVRLADAGERRIQRPARPSARSDEQGQNQQHEAGKEKPEAEIVDAREGHVRRADHQRDKVVPEAAEHRRNDDEEHHQQPVPGDEHVVELPVRIAGRVHEILDAGRLQLDAHRNRERDGDHARGPGEDEVENADVLVIGRREPAAEEAGMPVVRRGDCRHPLRPFAFDAPAFAWSSQSRNASGETAFMAIGMKAWSRPHNSEHCPK